MVVLLEESDKQAKDLATRCNMLGWALQRERKRKISAEGVGDVGEVADPEGAEGSALLTTTGFRAFGPAARQMRQVPRRGSPVAMPPNAQAGRPRITIHGKLKPRAKPAATSSGSEQADAEQVDTGTSEAVAFDSPPNSPQLGFMQPVTRISYRSKTPLDFST